MSANTRGPSVRIAVVSCSLNPASRSYQLARAVHSKLEAVGAEPDLIDLRDYDLPVCGRDDDYGHPEAVAIKQRLDAAEAIVVAAPVYNYGVNAAAKNIVELTGSAWKDKPVALVCSAGGAASYMAPMGFLNCLMLDFRCLIVPRFVYARKSEVSPEGEIAAAVEERIARLSQATLDLARAHAWLREQG